MFHREKIDSFAESIADVTADTVERWRGLVASGETVDVRVETIGEYITSMLERTFDRMINPGVS